MKMKIKKDSVKSNLEINSKLAEIFFQIADIFEIRKVKWKPQAYRIAAQTLESLKIPVTEIYKKEGAKGLDKLPGILCFKSI